MCLSASLPAPGPPLLARRSSPLLVLSAPASFGIAAGYIGGAVDMTISRVVDFMFSLPGLLIAIVVVSVVGGGYVIAVLVLSILNVQGDIRIVRSAAVKQRSLAYIESARTLGRAAEPHHVPAYFLEHLAHPGG